MVFCFMQYALQCDQCPFMVTGVVPQLDVEIRLTEDQWLNKEGNTISRGDLLTILQSVMFVLLPLNLGDNTIRYA